MAKVKFGAIAVDARNKVGGIVYSKNQYGAYVRTKVTPANPQSTYQVSVRNNFKDLSVSWGAVLTASQRAAWIAFAADHKVTDVFGSQLTLSGLATYQRLNRVLYQLGVTTIADPPADLAVTALLTAPVTAVAGVAAFDAAFTATPLGADEMIYLWATPPLPAGVNYLSNRLRMTAFSAAAQASPFDFLAEYVARFGTLIVNQRIGVIVGTVDSTKGAVSQGIQSIVTVAA